MREKGEKTVEKKGEEHEGNMIGRGDKNDRKRRENGEKQRRENL